MKNIGDQPFLENIYLSITNVCTNPEVPYEIRKSFIYVVCKATCFHLYRLLTL